jgi:hypothetical protein
MERDVGSSRFFIWRTVMPEEPRPAANENAAEGDPAVIDLELARQEEKKAQNDKRDIQPKRS